MGAADVVLLHENALRIGEEDTRLHVADEIESGETDDRLLAITGHEGVAPYVAVLTSKDGGRDGRFDPTPARRVILQPILKDGEQEMTAEEGARYGIERDHQLSLVRRGIQDGRSDLGVAFVERGAGTARSVGRIPEMEAVNAGSVRATRFEQYALACALAAVVEQRRRCLDHAHRSLAAGAAETAAGPAAECFAETRGRQGARPGKKQGEPDEGIERQRNVHGHTLKEIAEALRIAHPADDGTRVVSGGSRCFVLHD